MRTVRQVETTRDWADFKSVAHRIYRDDPFGLPDETIDLDRVLIDPPSSIATTRRTCAFVAYSDDEPVGRIVAIHDLNFTGYTAESIGFFGFYEAVDDQVVADSLLDAAAQWLSGRKLASMSGPFGPSMFYSAGIVVDEVPKLPLIGMPHNPSYYANHFEKWGLVGIKDFYSYLFDDPCMIYNRPEYARHMQIFEKIRARSEITFRPMKYRSLRRDARIVQGLYNKTFTNFWGYSPLSYVEFLELLKMMLPILDRKLTLLAELHGKPVGFLMAIPDANVAASRAARFSSRWMRAAATLWHVKRRGKSPVIDGVRVDMLFVDPECPDKAVASLLIMELSQWMRDRGYTRVEAAPVLDDSPWMKGSVLTRVEHTPHRTYRIYNCDLSTIPGGAS
ncbi:MAG: GNAT family N-acetyltransferase [Rhodococcus sp. (in: high G+C Gram-positive bacteria)]